MREILIGKMLPFLVQNPMAMIGVPGEISREVTKLDLVEEITILGIVIMTL
jgi:hypothetical protein